MLKNLLIRQKTKSKEVSPVSCKGYQDTDNVGIIFHETIVEKDLQFLKKELSDDGKSVSLMMRVDKFDKEKSYDYPYFFSKDISFNGSLNSSFLRDFTTSPMDMLLVLESDPDALSSFVVSKCNAIKIGFFVEGTSIDHLDLLVKPKSESSKYQDLLSYIRKVA